MRSLCDKWCFDSRLNHATMWPIRERGGVVVSSSSIRRRSAIASVGFDEGCVEIKHSDHLRFKLRVRGIPEQVPERIYRESKQRFYNHHSLRHVAILEVYYHRRRVLMMIAFDQLPDSVEIVTIHPITKDQIQDRVRLGRWTHEQIASEL